MTARTVPWYCGAQLLAIAWTERRSSLLPICLSDDVVELSNGALLPRPKCGTLRGMCRMTETPLEGRGGEDSTVLCL